MNFSYTIVKVVSIWKLFENYADRGAVLLENFVNGVVTKETDQKDV